jgi:hypothetical protein
MPMQDRLERFMARLLTDRAFRDEFVAAPQAVGAREGLSEEQCRAVVAMPPRDLHTAARSYAHKRESMRPRPASWLRRMFGR